jgi:hypothetical protein
MRYLKTLIILSLIFLIFGKIIYNNTKHAQVVDIQMPVWSSLDENGWSITKDCRFIKLYEPVGNDIPESGIVNELDIAGDPEKKILSVDLPESMYGSKKRLEISYATTEEYENCSPDVKKLIKDAIYINSRN